MKIKFILLILIPLIFIFYSCSENNVSNDDKDYISAIEAYKLVIKEAANAMSQGCGDVCTKYFISAAEREDFLRNYVENLRLMDDASIYVYIYDTNYVSIAHPVLKDYIGKNHYNDQDTKGNYISHIIQEKLRSNGEGFVEFYFDNPKTKLNEKKISYIKMIRNTPYWLGIGVYESTMYGWHIEKSELNRIKVKNCVSSTVTGFADVFAAQIKNSDDRIKFIRTYCDSTRFFDDKSGYFFVDDLNGFGISYPTRKDLENTDLKSIKDSKGVYPVVEMLKVINSSGKGFVEYHLVNPATNTVQKKIVYVEKIPGTEYFLGAGYYEED